MCHRKDEGKSAWDGLCHAWRLSWLLLFPAPHHSIYRMGVKVYGVRLSGWAREGKKTFASGTDRAPPCSSRVSCLAWSSLEGGGEVGKGKDPGGSDRWSRAHEPVLSNSPCLWFRPWTFACSQCIASSPRTYVTVAGLEYHSFLGGSGVLGCVCT